MKPATLGQAQKILSLFEDRSCEQVQHLLETGELAEFIKTGTTRRIETDHARHQADALWKLLIDLTMGKDVFITVPHGPCTNTPDGPDKYEVTVWHGNPGTKVSQGHVLNDMNLSQKTGARAIQLYLSERLNNKKGAWTDQLLNIGLYIGYLGAMTGKKMKLYTHTSPNGDKYDVISVPE